MTDPHPVSSDRTREPWPWIVGVCIVGMMIISTTFAWIAHRYPDPVVVDERYEADAKQFAPRLVDEEPVR